MNNVSPNLAFKSLPKEILERCLSFLDTRDICLGVECASKALRDASKESQVVWKHIALRRYGEEILLEALRTYRDASFKDMVADDMRLVAMPTISMEDCPIASFWQGNYVGLYYVCLVLGIQYHRPSDEVRIFIQVRGERDLRHPEKSSITRSSDKSLRQAKGFHGISFGPGHYQGYISFEASFFDREGDYSFLYADPRMETLPWLPDYQEVSVVNIVSETRVSERNDIAKFFRRALSSNSSIWGHTALYVLDGWSPFFTDESDVDSKATAELRELERFRPFVDRFVFTRHRSRDLYNKWWVERQPDNLLPAPALSVSNIDSSNGDSMIYNSFVDSLNQFSLVACWSNF